MYIRHCVVCVASHYPSLLLFFPLFPSFLLLHFIQTVGSALSYLEQRQEWVLDQISHLQQRVTTLGNALGVSPDDVGVLPQVQPSTLCQYAINFLDMCFYRVKLKRKQNSVLQSKK